MNAPTSWDERLQNKAVTHQYEWLQNIVLLDSSFAQFEQAVWPPNIDSSLLQSDMLDNSFDAHYEQPVPPTPNYTPDCTWQNIDPHLIPQSDMLNKSCSTHREQPLSLKSTWQNIDPRLIPQSDMLNNSFFTHYEQLLPLKSIDPGRQLDILDGTFISQHEYPESPDSFLVDHNKQALAPSDVTHTHSKLINTFSESDQRCELYLAPSMIRNPIMTVIETEDQDTDAYAILIYRALMSAPNHSMVLQEIYQWFRDHTSKDNSESKGWKNSIRHNLSMNDAFKKSKPKISTEDTKQLTKWVLQPFAIKDGVQSTTRYRKKRSIPSKTPALLRQLSGRKGGMSTKNAFGSDKGILRRPQFMGDSHYGGGSREQRQISPLTQRTIWEQYNPRPLQDNYICQKDTSANETAIIKTVPNPGINTHR